MVAFLSHQPHEPPAPAAQETGEWHTERRESRAVVVNGNGEHVAFGCGNYTSERLQRAEQIVRDHNEHQSLSAERKRLREFVARFAKKGCVLNGQTCAEREREKLCVPCRAASLLNQQDTAGRG